MSPNVEELSEEFLVPPPAGGEATAADIMLHWYFPFAPRCLSEPCRAGRLSQPYLMDVFLSHLFFQAADSFELVVQ